MQDPINSHVSRAFHEIFGFFWAWARFPERPATANEPDAKE